MQNVNNFNKIRGIMKMACYCLFNSVLNKLLHIVVYILSTRQNNSIYRNDPVQKFTHPWILIICVRDPRLFLYLVIVESLVGLEQFNCLLFSRKKNPLLHMLWFPIELSRDITEISPLWGTSSLQPFLKSYWLTPVKWLANCRKACKYGELETV